jgi:hypothetical protein
MQHARFAGFGHMACAGRVNSIEDGMKIRNCDRPHLRSVRSKASLHFANTPLSRYRDAATTGMHMAPSQDTDEDVGLLRIGLFFDGTRNNAHNLARGRPQVPAAPGAAARG